MKLLHPRYIIIATAAIAISCQTNVTVNTEADTSEAIESQVFTLADTETLTEDFGTINLFANGVSTVGMKDAVTGVLTILPNSEAHPPHKHSEEELLIVTKGSGTWSLNGKDFPAKTGDLLYAAPWDLHGIFNNDTTNLEFYFVKWNNKRVATPKEK